MKKEILLVVIFYVVMSVLYYTSIVIDIGKWDEYLTGLINYALKAILTLPLLWLFFRRKADASTVQKVLLHLVTMPIFIYLWIAIYYAICDEFGFFRFRGSRVVWDIYMTTLFYFIQFAIFHLYAYNKELKKQQLLREATEYGRACFWYVTPIYGTSEDQHHRY